MAEDVEDRGMFGPRVQKTIDDKLRQKLEEPAILFTDSGMVDFLPVYTVKEGEIAVTERFGRAVRNSKKDIGISLASYLCISAATYSGLDNILGYLGVVNEKNAKLAALAASAILVVSGATYAIKRLFGKDIIKGKDQILNEKANYRVHKDYVERHLKGIRNYLKESAQEEIAEDANNILSRLSDLDLIRNSLDEETRPITESTIRSLRRRYREVRYLVDDKLEDIREKLLIIDPSETQLDIGYVVDSFNRVKGDINELIAHCDEKADLYLSYKDKEDLTIKYPGLCFKFPFWIDRVTFVDTREVKFNPIPQNTYTKEKIPVIVDAIANLKVMDPDKALYAIQDLEGVVSDYLDAFFRNYISDLGVEELASAEKNVLVRLKEYINEGYNERGEREVGRNIEKEWGIEFVDARIEEIFLPYRIEQANSNYAAAVREGDAEITLKQKFGEAEVIELQKRAEAIGKLKEALQDPEGKTAAVLDTIRGKNVQLVSIGGLESGVLKAIGGDKSYNSESK